MPVSYVCDIPEAEDMLVVYRGTRTASPSFKCLVENSEMALSSDCSARTFSDTMPLLERLRRGNHDSVKLLKARSMLKITPVLSNFPILEIHT